MKFKAPRSPHPFTAKHDDAEGVRIRNGSRWKRTSRIVRSLNPLCQRCGEKFSEHVHHRTPVGDDPSLAYAWSNLEALCKACHEATHARRQ